MPTNTLPINLLKSKNPTPLVTALQSGNHHIKWTKCADLPFAMSYASVVVDRQKEMIYVTPGSSTDATVYNKVFNLDMKTGGWNELPSPDHRFGILQIINRKLCIIGGSHVTTRKSIKKVSTYDEESKRWIQFYPDMLSPRFKPGVVTYGDHMVVLGGTKDNDNINDDIEVFNWRLAITQRNVQWQRSALTLPVPMWGISPTIVDEHLYIVGYTQPKGTSNRTYRLSINLLIFLLQQPQHTRALDRQAVWSELSRAPHFFTALVPELYPPIVVGGGDSRGDTATSDVCLYDISGNVWKKVASLPNARLNTAVATIDESTIIVFGGYTNGKTTQSAMDTCIATVEIGQAESSYYV